jgi:hypothetical protein
MALPIPFVPPVTTATFPFNSMIPLRPPPASAPEPACEP